MRILIEVKFARSASDFRELERQIAQDAAAYFTGNGWRYDTLVVFIYDNSASVQEHAVTETALLKLPAGLGRGDSVTAKPTVCSVVD